MSSKKTPAENKAATPPSLSEINEAADKAQAEGNERAAKIGASGKRPTDEELAKSGYSFPEGYFDQEDPNAGHESVEQRAGDGGADSPIKK